MGKPYHDDMTMDEIMRLWPATIRVILDHGLLCVGCPIASFHTIDDAVREHRIDAAEFRVDMQAVIEGKAPASLNPGRDALRPAASGDAARSRSPAGGRS